MIARMRRRGPVTDPRDMGQNDHIAWVYSSLAGFDEEAVSFLADGRAQGLRLAYVGPGEASHLRWQLRALPGLDELLERSALELLPLDQVFGTGPVEADSALAKIDALTKRALAEGYRGLRVAADLSALVSSDAQLDALARYELELDAYTQSHPFSAMCSYSDDLGNERLMQLACLHPLFPEKHAPFQLGLGDGGVVYVAGEVDLLCHEAFAQTVARVDELLERDMMVLDMGELGFIDHRGLLVLEQRAVERGAQVKLRRAPPVVGRLVELMDFSRVAVESFQ